MKLRRPFLVPLTALLALQPARPLLAQDEAIYTANFEQANIEEVIQIVHEATGRTILTDQRVRGQQITFYHQEPMTADDLWRAFEQMLRVVAFTVVESGGIWTVVPDQTLRTEPSEVNGGGVGAAPVTRVVALENVQATQLMAVLRPLNSQVGNVLAAQEGNMLIIVDRADNARRMEEVVRLIDTSNAQGLDVVQLQYASAEDVTQKITAVAQAQASGGIVSIQAIPDERTNRVLLTGTGNEVAYYRDVAESLDLPSAQGGGSQVRYLYYADAEEVADILSQQFGGTQVVEDAETAADPTGGNIAVVPHIGTNSLVINAPSRIQQDMLAVVDRLDIPRAQVHIQAIIVEMSENRAAELGLTWIIDGSGGDQVVGLTNFSQTTGGILQLAQPGEDGQPDPGLIRDGVTAAIGNLSDTGTSWAAVVSALQGDAETNVMQIPTLTVLDNQEGLITVGQNVPFRTGEFTNTGGNQGAVNPFSTIQRDDVGTSLTITPRINEGTGMRLSIIQEVSSLSESALASDVITNERRIETEVFVDDGDILVLGGLMDDTLRSGEQRVPFLGRIPGLRWLFRARNTERNKSSLMVFIRPTILRDSVDSSRLSRGRYRDFQEAQRERAGEPVPLMKDADRPSLPPLEPSETDDLPPMDPPPTLEELFLEEDSGGGE